MTESESSPVGVASRAPLFEYRKVGFRADIQGLRAVAVILVVLYHAHLPGLSGGYVGVDVFFVISGFLITAHLLGSLAKTGRVDFGEFYARRIRRIIPASLAVLLLSVGAALIFIPPLLLPPVLRDALATALYIPNFAFANRSVDYLSDPNPSIFQHYWSLGVEEQFYLFWPVVLVVAFLLSRRSRHGIAAVLAVVFVVSLGLSLVLTERSQPWAFFMMPTRAWEFAVGGLVAYVVTTGRWAVPPRLGAALAWLGLVGVLATAVIYDDSTVFPGTAAIAPVVATALVILGGSARQLPWGAAAVLSTRPMVFIGALSYSIYLVHWPLLMIPQVAISDQRDLPLPTTLALALLSIPVAWLIYRVVENPVRSWSWLTVHRPAVTLLATLVIATVVVAACVGAGRAVASQPLSTGRSASPFAVSGNLAATEFVPDNLRPGLRDASADNPAIYASGCHLSAPSTTAVGCTTGPADAPISVALFGDSHAAQWYPALAELADRGEIVLTTHTKSSCPSAQIQSYPSPDGYPECDIWRDGVVASLTSNPPDVVVLANFAVSAGDPSAAGFAEAWQKATHDTAFALSSTSRVVVIGDTPHFEIAPSACLSAHVNDATACAGSREQSLWPAIAEAERAAVTGVGGSYLDPNQYLCDEVACPVILGDVLVYRDSHHLTATFSASLADVIFPTLVASSP